MGKKEVNEKTVLFGQKSSEKEDTYQAIPALYEQNYRDRKVSVIIPTLNAEKNISLLIDRLLEQTVSAEIIVVDSSSDDNTQAFVRGYGDPVRLICISRKEFDHGGTRDNAFRMSTGDFVLFLSQDAMPTDNRYIEKLAAVFDNDSIAAVYARQIAYPDAPEYEKLTRHFNYPEESRIWSEKNISELEIKAFFFSNVCSAYRRTAYLKAGGFDHPVESNEDMLMAEKLLRGGCHLAYNADAKVFHSHNFTLLQDFRRSVLSARVMNRYKERLAGAKRYSHGIRYVYFVLIALLKKGSFVQAAAFIPHAFVRFAGDLCGRFNHAAEANNF